MTQPISPDATRPRELTGEEAAALRRVGLVSAVTLPMTVLAVLYFGGRAHLNGLAILGAMVLSCDLHLWFLATSSGLREHVILKRALMWKAVGGILAALGLFFTADGLLAFAVVSYFLGVAIVFFAVRSLVARYAVDKNVEHPRATS